MSNFQFGDLVRLTEFHPARGLLPNRDYLVQEVLSSVVVRIVLAEDPDADSWSVPTSVLVRKPSCRAPMAQGDGAAYGEYLFQPMSDGSVWVYDADANPVPGLTLGIALCTPEGQMAMAACVAGLEAGLTQGRSEGRIRAQLELRTQLRALLGLRELSGFEFTADNARRVDLIVSED